eukprot:CAMPEP_0184708982 /NCGR_PEP_ID=MMETSP0314-20130426/198_1 /TAXON_ID=38298 /ORGANISM="Rhodella maculata, Strain CCMP 736" /LENGTH=70 /DNA_ID=CAMNT_0027170609 /DNA_START=70 /DNA_END=279 /DNA_ORIENTATION=-
MQDERPARRRGRGEGEGEGEGEAKARRGRGRGEGEARARREGWGGRNSVHTVWGNNVEYQGDHRVISRRG